MFEALKFLTAYDIDKNTCWFSYRRYTWERRKEKNKNVNSRKY